MGFTLRLYNTKKRKNSTKQPVNADLAVSYNNAILKQNTSIVNPVFIIKDGDTTLPRGRYVSAQYDTGLTYYYWINTFTSVATGIWELDCSMDVLATWKEDIGNTYAYVSRTASGNTIKIVDSLANYTPSYSHTSNSYTSSIPWATGFGEAIYAITMITSGQSTFTELGSTTYYVSYTGLHDLLNEFSVITADTLDDFVSSFGSLYGAIRSVTMIPIKFASTEMVSAGTVKIRQYTIKTTLYGLPYTRFADDTKSINFTKSASALDYAPYAIYYLTLPYIGRISIGDIMTTGLSIREQCDYGTGAYAVSLYVDGEYMQTLSVNTGVSIPLLEQSINLIQNSVTGVVGLMGNFAQAAFGSVGGLKGMVDNTLQTGSTSDAILTSGGGGTILNACYIPRDIIAHSFKKQLASTQTDAAQSLGLPYCKYVQLKTLSGYIQCVNASVLGTGLDVRDRINEYLNGGFYYE